jgi:hypothetical protein
MGRCPDSGIAPPFLWVLAACGGYTLWLGCLWEIVEAR